MNNILPSENDSSKYKNRSDFICKVTPIFILTAFWNLKLPQRFLFFKKKTNFMRQI